MHSQEFIMFRAIGVILVLWYLSQLFSHSFNQLDTTTTALLHLAERTAVTAEERVH